MRPAGAAAEEGQPPRFALIPFGQAPNRFLTLPSDGGYEYILLEDVVRLFIDRFFPGERVLEVAPFRITRNADLSVREDMASDLLEEMEEVLEARKESDCVRLEIADDGQPDAAGLPAAGPGRRTTAASTACPARWTCPPSCG